MPATAETRSSKLFRLASVALVLGSLGLLPNESNASHHETIGKTPAVHPAVIPKLGNFVIHANESPKIEVHPTPLTTTTTTSTTIKPEINLNISPTGLLRRIGGCESDGAANAPIIWTAQNRYSSASGGFQILDSTWNFFAGYSKARFAPPYIQIEKADELLPDANHQWSETKWCWE